jgi:hypothetical protein
MKTLMALSVLQTIGILVLIVKCSGNEPQPTLESRLQSSFAAATSPHLGRDADEARLRSIIREELARQPQVQANRHDTPASAVVTPPRTESMDRHQQELVAQQIETYKSMGSITSQQMENLQVQIAQLDEASRRQMLGKLIRALNSGDIKGRL